MAAEAPVKTGSRPFAQNSIIWERKGPLPVWAWALLVLAGALVIAWWRRNRSAGKAAQVATGYTDELPGDQSAPIILIAPQPSSPSPLMMPRRRRGTAEGTPPGAGRDRSPGARALEEITAKEGWNLDGLIADVQSYDPGFTEQKFMQLNPGVKLGQSNAGGWVSSSNPGPGVTSFVGDQRIKIPRRVR